jgi:hypothetical protein
LFLLDIQQQYIYTIYLSYYQHFKSSENNLDSPLALNLKDNLKVVPLSQDSDILATSAESRLLSALFEISKGDTIGGKVHGPTTIYLTEG